MVNCVSLRNGLLTSVLLSLSASAYAQIEFVDDLEGLTEQEIAWLEGDAPRPDSTGHINEGELNWLSLPGKKGEYHLENQMIINNESLKSGWINFIQCHYNLDPISKVEVVYKPKSVKNLEIRRSSNIHKAHAQESSVILSNVQQGGEVCISGQSNTLRKSELSEDEWVISRGPYMRKFFDGFYPMQVTEILDWSSTNLVFNHFEPKSSTGQKQNLSSNTLKVNYRFEGVLRSQYEFILK